MSAEERDGREHEGLYISTRQARNNTSTIPSESQQARPAKSQQIFWGTMGTGEMYKLRSETYPNGAVDKKIKCMWDRRRQER